MIDTHCHLLPGIDDGARDLRQALAMAQAAYANGIRFAIMTPHINPGRYDNTAADIARRCKVFQLALDRAGIPLRIGMGAEVRLCPEVLPMIDEGSIPFLGEHEGYRVMLLEFPHSHIPPGADKLVDRLLALKVRPIIAHPERNKDVMRKFDKIRPFIEMGCLLQLTASAVAGRFGERAHERALQLLETQTFTVLATDAHNLKARYPELKEGMQAASEIVGHRAARRMVLDNPALIVRKQLVRGGQLRETTSFAPRQTAVG